MNAKTPKCIYKNVSLGTFMTLIFSCQEKSCSEQPSVAMRPNNKTTTQTTKTACGYFT